MTSEASSHIEDVPESFGEYELIERLAIGGMAEIYKARTTGFGGFEKIVVIKRLHERLSEDEDFIDMMIDEATIAVRLNHPNIANIFDLGEIEGRYFIVMEYIEGPDISRLLNEMERQEKRLPIPMALRLAIEVCAALEYAHTQRDAQGRPLGIVHRDVSPPNIMVSTQGEVKLVDFGIAKARRQVQESKEGMIKGKFHYMAPEQAHNRRVDARTDIFSTGMVLYEMLAGCNPYDDVAESELLETAREAPIPDLREHRPDLDPALASIVMQAVERRPDDRWNSAAAFEEALRDYMEHECEPFDRRRLAEAIRPAWKRISEAKAPPEEATAALDPGEYQVTEASVLFEEESERTAPPDARDEAPFEEEIPTREAHEEPVFEPEQGASHEPSDFDHAPTRERARSPSASENHEVSNPQAAPLSFEEDAPTQIWRKGEREEHEDASESEGPPDLPTDVSSAPTSEGSSRESESSPPDPEVSRKRDRSRMDSDRHLPPDPSPRASDASSDPETPSPSHTSAPRSSRSQTPRRPHESSPPRRTAPVESVSSDADARRDSHETTREGPYALITWWRRARQDLEQRGLDPKVIGTATLASVFGGIVIGGLGLLIYNSNTPSSSPPEQISSSSAPSDTIDISVTSEPSDAELLLDGQLEGRTPHVLSDLERGSSHKLTLRRKGYTSKTIDFEASEARDPIEVDLSARQRATLKVSTDPSGADIRLDGESVGASPVTIEDLSRDESHRIVAQLDDRSIERTVEWSSDDDETRTLELTFEDPNTDDEDDEQARNQYARRETETDPTSQDREQRRDPEPRRERETVRPPESTERRANTDPTPSEDRGSEPSSTTNSSSEEGGEGSSTRLNIWDLEKGSNQKTGGGSEPTSGGSSPSSPATDRSSPNGGTGYLSVQVKKGWGKVYVDGSVVASETPLVRHEITAGDHRVKVYYPVLKRYSSVKQVTIGSEEHEKVIFSP